MIYKLAQDEYERVRAVFEGLRYNLVIDSVIDGNTPAWVVVDDVSCPKTALMWNRQDALLLAGHDGDDAFNHAVDELITARVIPDARRRYIPQLSLHYFPQTWEGKVDVILRDKRPEKAQRRCYALDRLKVDWRAQIRPGYEMRRIDEELLASDYLGNVEQVVGWVRSFWRSNHDFEKTGFGFCLVHGATIVSWCLSVYVSGKNYELGLATAPAYRRRGCATLTAAACVEHCTANNLTPHWHCWDDNLPSIAVAEKVGFKKRMDYEVYRLELTNLTI